MALDLRYGKDDENRHLKIAFDSDAANYDAIRPRYCDALFQAVIQAAELASDKCCLEIGPGTGQATEPILKTGAAVTAAELGQNLAEFLAYKYRDDKNLQVWQGDFLQFPETQQYDLIYSATAFHWIPREEGFAKVKRLLKPGGTLALFWNHPIPGGGVGTAADEALQGVYRKYGKGRRDTPFDGSTCPAYCNALEQAGFSQVRCTLFESQRCLDADAYIQLLRSYSDHAKLLPEERDAFEKDIRDTILSLDNGMPILDRMDLYLARMP